MIVPNDLPRIMGVRIHRSSPVIYVDAGDGKAETDSRVLVELDSSGIRVNATVVISPEQLISASGLKPDGRCLGPSEPHV